jgi:glycosyltransferase involved in cell wall biosynthesis
VKILRRLAVDVRCLEPPMMGGFARYTLELVRALDRCSHAEVIGLTDRPLAHDPGVKIRTVQGRSEAITEQVLWPRALSQLGVDVLLCPANRGLPLVAPCATVLTLHDAVEWDPQLVGRRSGRSRLRFEYATVASLLSASAVITVSRSAAQSLTEVLGVDKRRVHVIPEAAPWGFHPSAAVDDPAVLARHGLEPGYVLYVGSFYPKKDVATLVAAYGLLPADDRPPLVLVGDATTASGELLSTAAGLGARQLGAVRDQDLPSLYRNCGVFVFPAIAEGFGLPVAEAMASGAPVLAAASGALPEVVGSAGSLTPPRDPLALARAMSRLLTDGRWRSELAEAGLRRSQELTWDAAAALTLEICSKAQQRRLVADRLRNTHDAIRYVGRQTRSFASRRERRKAKCHLAACAARGVGQVFPESEAVAS